MATSTIKSPMTLLWENSSPSSNFSAQTINNIDASKFTLFLVECYTDTNRDGKVFAIVYKGIASLVNVCVSRIFYRSITVNSNSIVFADGKDVNTYNNTTTANNRIIPYRIYGLM